MRRAGISVILVSTMCLQGCIMWNVDNMTSQRVPLGFRPPSTLPLTIGLRELPSDPKHPLPLAYGDLAKAVAEHLAQQHLFMQVLYPLRPDDRYDLLLELGFSGKIEQHYVWNIFFSALIGASWFILEPILIYDFDTKLWAKGRVLRNDQVLRSIEAMAHMDVDAQFLGLYIKPQEKERRLLRQTIDQLLDLVAYELAHDPQTYDALTPTPPALSTPSRIPTTTIPSTMPPGAPVEPPVGVPVLPTSGEPSGDPNG